MSAFRLRSLVDRLFPLLPFTPVMNRDQLPQQFAHFLLHKPSSPNSIAADEGSRLSNQVTQSITWFDTFIT
jgi:hypothetical protein